jgi:hypothetical protein
MGSGRDHGTIVGVASRADALPTVDEIGAAVAGEQLDEIAPGDGLTTTVECRWWAPGRLREEFAAWFATLGEVRINADRPRRDTVPAVG